MGTSVSLSGGSRDLSKIDHVVSVTDPASLRVQKPAILWVYMQTCHWSQVSAEAISAFAKESPVPVYGIDGVAHAQQLYKSGFRPNGFPTVYLLKDSKKAVEMKTNPTVENLRKFVMSSAR